VMTFRYSSDRCVFLFLGSTGLLFSFIYNTEVYYFIFLKVGFILSFTITISPIENFILIVQSFVIVLHLMFKVV